MRSDPRCVFDTNVLISALLFDASKPAQAFFAVLRNGEMLLSADVISEISEVLGREKFRRYVTEEERERFLRNLLQEAKLLELAVNGNADCIVSGDDDLLTLGPFKSVAILTPNDFLDALSQRDG